MTTIYINIFENKYLPIRMSNNYNNNQDSDSDNLFVVSDNMNSVKNGSNSNNQDQGFNEYEYEATKYLEQQAMKEIQRRRVLIRQVHAFIKAQKKFKNEDFFNRRHIYLISKNWLQKWKIYTQFDLILNRKKLSTKNTTDQTSLPKINQDLIDITFQPSIKIEKYEDIDVCLKQNLKEQIDFIYASQQMANLFANYKGITIKREIIKLKGEYIVDLYPLKVTLILISQRILNQIRIKKRLQLITQTLLFSKGGSYANLILYVFQHIVRCLNLKHYPSHQQVLTSDSHIEYYFLNPSFNKQKVMKRITLSLQSQNVKQNCVCLPIQSFDYKSIVSEVVVVNQPILVCQIHEQNQPKQRKILYDSGLKIIPYTKCPNCKKQLQLKTICRCKFVAYCSEQCLNSDTQHFKKCQARNKQSNKKIEMNKSKNGLVGLTNLGNTCFMNSGIQCLSHIPELTQYFITDSYLQDINTVSNLGTKGNLAKVYSQMLKSLWLGSDSSFSPYQFKRTLGGFHRSFQGHYQQDAGEFITYLLDGLHQDLNKVKKKPYFESKQFDNRPQNIIADEQWSQFLQRNNSKIVQLMYGQFRSSVCCPSCNFKSVQFDPFLMCSIPIVEQSSRTISICFQDDQKLSQQNYHIPYKFNDKLSKVVQYCRQKKNFKEQTKFIIYSSRTELNVDCQIDQVKNKYKNSAIYVRAIDRFHQSLNQGIKIVVIVKALNQDNISSNLFFRMYKFKRNIYFSKIHEFLYKSYQKLYEVKDYHSMIMSKDIKDREIALYNFSQQMNKCWKCETKCRPQTCNFPYYQKDIQTSNLKDKKVCTLQYVIRAKTTYVYKRDNYIRMNTNGLLNCFDAFQQPEILTKDNAWRCPKCKNMVNAKKRMMLYKIPKILIICLKRFKKKQYGQQKNHGVVKFPLKNLDLTEKVINKQLPQITSSKNGESTKDTSQKKAVYQLFGVSYHYGEANSGHYDAACKNVSRNVWYKFDDSKLDIIDESSIVNGNAYILFYRRK